MGGVPFAQIEVSACNWVESVVQIGFKCNINRFGSTNSKIESRHLSNYSNLPFFGAYHLLRLSVPFALYEKCVRI